MTISAASERRLPMATRNPIPNLSVFLFTDRLLSTKKRGLSIAARNTLSACPHAARRVGHNSCVVRLIADKDRDQSRTSRPRAQGAHYENQAVEGMADNCSADVGERKRARGGYPQARDRAEIGREPV